MSIKKKYRVFHSLTRLGFGKLEYYDRKDAARKRYQELCRMVSVARCAFQQACYGGKYRDLDRTERGV